jgi:Recombinase
MGSERLAEIRQSSPRGRSCGSTPETRGRGPLAHFLRNRFYIGEIVFKGEVLPGEQPAILDRELFDAVQAKLNEQRTHHTVVRGQSEALLIGRIYDDRGNRMSPSHVRKGGIKYRYYLSSPLLHGRPERACTVRRVPATEVEALVGSAVREHFEDCTEIADRDLIRNHVVRVEVQADQLVVELKAGGSLEWFTHVVALTLRLPSPGERLRTSDRDNRNRPRARARRGEIWSPRPTLPIGRSVPATDPHHWSLDRRGREPGERGGEKMVWEPLHPYARA